MDDDTKTGVWLHDVSAAAATAADSEPDGLLL